MRLTNFCIYKWERSMNHTQVSVLILNRITLSNASNKIEKSCFYVLLFDLFNTSQCVKLQTKSQSLFTILTLVTYGYDFSVTKPPFSMMYLNALLMLPPSQPLLPDN